MSTTLGLRERKKQQTHRALSAAAVRLATERGLDHVTVEDICGEAGVSPRTFFNYFASKEDAVVLPDPSFTARLERSVVQMAELPAELSAVAALTVVLREEAEHIEADREQWLMRLSIVGDNPALLIRSLAYQGTHDLALANAIARRTGTDVDRDFYPALLAWTALGAFRAAVQHWFLAGGKTSLPDLVTSAMHALAQGLPNPVLETS
ncbi:AcrR family transcriptional regulator [Crossiella equi]|uniref:AcrR family transcriptional regulator n=1 Tax=Crossiella equi TaxID=130796 RepID=A0ABS5AAS0_9PSEU|nr:TetR family transcriptional regulator [Crossiella equi]MBP2473387.1 AcrR family transcriptional regulator [Crossiella equi]